MASDTEKKENPKVDTAQQLLQVVKANTPSKTPSVIPPEFLKELQEITRALKSQAKSGLAQNTSLKTLIDNFTGFQRAQEDKSTGAEAKDALKTSKPQEVVIAGVKDPVLEKISKSLQALGIAPKAATAAVSAPAASAGGSGGGLGALFSKILGSSLTPLVVGLAGSFALAIGSWFNEGPFKGLMKELGNIGIKVFLPKVVGMAGKLFPAMVKFLKPIASKLPVIGFVINLGSAISRVLAGDVVGGIIDLASGLASFIPGFGTAISIGLGLLNAARDLSGTTETTKGNIKPDTGWYGKFEHGLNGLLKKSLKYLPGVGTIMALKESFDRFKAGDVKGGLKSLVKAGYSIIPGLGAIVTWLIDEKTDNTPPSASTSNEKFDSKSIFTAITKGVQDKFKSILKALKKLPFVPDFIIDKIGSFFGISLDEKSASTGVGKNTDKVVQEMGTTKSTQTSKTLKYGSPGAIPTGSTVDIPAQTQVATLPPFETIRKAQESVEQPTQKSAATPTTANTTPETEQPTDSKPAGTTPETKEATQKSNSLIEGEDYENVRLPQKGFPSRLQQSTSSIPVQSNTSPRVPLDPFVSTTSLDVMPESKIDRIIQGFKDATSPQQASNTSATALNMTSGGSNVTNIFNNATERDIPYLERNKYRQQLMYVRGLL